MKDKSTGIRLMGFGHRVYKNYDPRAKVMQETAKRGARAARRRHNLSPTLQVAKRAREDRARDEYFIERKLYPNVDFYSGIILEAIGFPTSMFTAIFALSRTVGWIAQWKEMIADPQKKIGRPRQLYTARRAAITCRSKSAEQMGMASTASVTGIRRALLHSCAYADSAAMLGLRRIVEQPFSERLDGGSGCGAPMNSGASRCRQDVRQAQGAVVAVQCLIWARSPMVIAIGTPASASSSVTVPLTAAATIDSAKPMPLFLARGGHEDRRLPLRHGFEDLLFHRFRRQQHEAGHAGSC